MGKRKSKVATNEPGERRSLGVKIYVHAPAGACPHRLAAADEETVREWVEKVRETFLRDDRVLDCWGMSYFVQQFYPRFTTVEHDQVVAIVRRIFGEEQEARQESGEVDG